MKDNAFVNFVLLHGYSLDDFSLMYGKMGCALSLFEYSRNYHNELAEKHAFNLLQEVLASSVEKNTFSEGRMGIAWALIYLINNQYIEAEYQELYGQEHEKVLAFIKEVEKGTINVASYIDAISFLMIARKYMPESDFESLLFILIENLSDYFNVKPNNFFEAGSFYEFSSRILGCFNLYEELASCKRNLIDIITQMSVNLFNDGFVCENMSFGVNMLQYSICNKREDIKKIALKFIEAYVSNIVLKAIDLREAINIFYNLNKLQKLDIQDKWICLREDVANLLFDRKECLYKLDDCKLNTLKEGIPKLLLTICLLNKDFHFDTHFIMLH